MTSRDVVAALAALLLTAASASAQEVPSTRAPAHALDQRALGYLAEDRLALAEHAARRAIAEDPAYAPPHNTLGLAQLRRGDPASARDSFVRARELDPTLFAAHMNEGALALDVRDYDSARAAFLRCVELRPRDYDAWVSLGVALRGSNDIAGAQGAYDRALALDSSRAEAYFDLGVLHQLHRDGSEDALAEGVSHFLSFYDRAQGRPDLAAGLDAVLRHCTFGWRGRGYRPPSCRRLIDGTPHEIMFTLALTLEMRAVAVQMQAEMQAEMARIQEQADAAAASPADDER